MSFGSPPLRFLVAVIGGWTAMRWAMLAPAWRGEDNAALRPAGPVAPAPRPAAADAAARWAAGPGLLGRRSAGLASSSRPAVPEFPSVLPPAEEMAVPKPEMARLTEIAPSAEVARPAAGRLPVLDAAPRSREHRWSASAWALVRGGEPGALAVGGTLGGSQLGGRLLYRLAGPVALSARLSAPAGGIGGAEASLGIEWTPAPALPLRLLAERRQALGRERRSAFALVAHGGIADWRVAGALRLDAYVQAGMVGLRSREPFADGSVRLTLPLDGRDRLRLGGGAWAAAQRGIARFDAGPHAALRLAGARVALDWRLRLAGDAAPGSGPALTLATDF